MASTWWLRHLPSLVGTVAREAPLRLLSLSTELAQNSAHRPHHLWGSLRGSATAGHLLQKWFSELTVCQVHAQPPRCHLSSHLSKGAPVLYPFTAEKLRPREDGLPGSQWVNGELALKCAPASAPTVRMRPPLSPSEPKGGVSRWHWGTRVPKPLF